MALALTLLVSAGLLIQSFIRLQKVDPGFNPRGVLMAYLMLPSAKYAEPGRQAAFLKEAIGQIEASPGVESAGGASAVPLSGWNDAGYFSVEGRPGPGPREPVIDAEQPKITPEYFRAMGIPVLKGRAFTWADNENSPDVAIVSEDLVRRYWPDEDPIGKRLSINNRNGQPVWRQVVGVVKDVKHDALTSPIRPAIYVPVSQLSSTSAILAVRARTDPTGLGAAIRRAVTAADSEQPVLKLTTIERSVSDSASQRRFQTQALTAFAAVAMMLAAIGIYGVMAYTVSRRTHEIGIRVALGAPRRDILRMIVIQGMRLALIGVVIGLAGALALARLIKGVLFGVSATDPLTYALIALLLTIVALLACWIPARRATKVDPMTALRVE
jgi:putative ABC transport system permease protein